MMLPEKCSHGIRWGGASPPRCVECEIILEKEGLAYARVSVALHEKRLKALYAERTRPALAREGETNG